MEIESDHVYEEKKSGNGENGDGEARIYVKSGPRVDFRKLSHKASERKIRKYREKRILLRQKDVSIEAAGFGTNEKSIGGCVDAGRITNDDTFEVTEQTAISNGVYEEDGLQCGAIANIKKVTVLPKNEIEINHEEEKCSEAREESTLPLCKMVINRYPGHLFIQIDKIEKLTTVGDDVEAISIKVESEGFSYETRKHHPWTSINVSEILKIPIDRIIDGNEPLIRFVLLFHHRARGMFSKNEITKSREIVLKIDAEKIRSVHNNLIEHAFTWSRYTSKNTFKGIFKDFMYLFSKEAPNAWTLRTYQSFISNDELQLIPAQFPSCLTSLSKWLVVKRFSYNTWFRGFVNMRGNVGESCTNLWKRRYVKCYGYIIFVFSEHSRRLVGTVNLVNACFDPTVRDKVYSENFLSVSIGSKYIEFHFDTKDGYEMCREMLSAMLPGAFFHENK